MFDKKEEGYLTISDNTTAVFQFSFYPRLYLLLVRELHEYLSKYKGQR